MNRRIAGSIALSLILLATFGDSPLSLNRLVLGAVQNPTTATAVYFKSSTDSKFRKIAVRFNISGTGHTITLGNASSNNENFSAGATNTVQDTLNNMTYVSAVYVSKVIPAGDSPAKSGALSDITFTITIDNNQTGIPVKAPVIDIDPCATK